VATKKKPAAANAATWSEFNEALRMSPEERRAQEIQGMVDDAMDLPAERRARVFALVDSLICEQQEEAHRRLN
jgi:hypothetical protein